MSTASRSMTRNAALLAIVAMTLAACGGSPTAAPTTAKKATTAKPAATAPATTGTTKAPTEVEKPAANAATGTVMIMLSSLKADGLAGVAVELSGPGLEEPIGKTLTADELKTSNTLAFENIPVGKLTAKVGAFDKNEESLGETETEVAVKADAEAKVALQLSAPAVPSGPVKVDFKLVDATAFDAPAPTGSPAPTAGGEDDEPNTPAPKPSASPISSPDKALSVEITNKTTIRKYLLFKRLEVTVLVTNENKTETLDGEVKVEFHKMKGFLTKEDAIVETLTAPVSGLAPGKSVEITLTSTVSAEDAEATVHTVVATSSASTYE